MKLILPSLTCSLKAHLGRTKKSQASFEFTVKQLFFLVGFNSSVLTVHSRKWHFHSVSPSPLCLEGDKSPHFVVAMKRKTYSGSGSTFNWTNLLGEQASCRHVIIQWGITKTASLLTRTTDSKYIFPGNVKYLQLNCFQVKPLPMTSVLVMNSTFCKNFKKVIFFIFYQSVVSSLTSSPFPDFHLKVNKNTPYPANIL